MTFIRATPNMTSTARVSGGIVTQASATTVDITAGIAQFVDTTDPLAPVQELVPFGPFLGVTPVSLLVASTTFFCIDINGQLIESVVLPTTAERRILVFIGFAQHFTGVISLAESATTAVYLDVPVNLTDLAESLGDINLSGNIVEPNGTNLNFDKTSGTTFGLQRTVITNPGDPNVISSPSAIPATFISTHRDGVGGFTTLPPTSLLDVGNWDDGSGGLVALGANEWANFRIVYAPGPETLVMFYPQNMYTGGTAPADAVAAIFTEAHDRDTLAGPSDTIGVISARGGAADLSLATDALFTATHRFRKV